MRMNPEIAQNVRTFLRELEELTGRTGIKLAGLTEEFAPVLEVQDGDAIVAHSLVYDPDTGAYQAAEPTLLPAEIAAPD